MRGIGNYMPTKLQLVNRRFGRLLVVSEAPRVGRDIRWKCLCDCGTERTVSAHELSSGQQSCGCLVRERTIERSTTHGCGSRTHRTREHRAWSAMKTRCTNPRQRTWEHYGGRGITICERWMNSFEAFLEDMGSCPQGRSIDRIDVNGNYEPGNCRWATDTEQRHNQRPARQALNARVLAHDGLSITVSEWSRRLGISTATIFGRLRRQKPIGTVLSTQDHRFSPSHHPTALTEPKA